MHTVYTFQTFDKKLRWGGWGLTIVLGNYPIQGVVIVILLIVLCCLVKLLNNDTILTMVCWKKLLGRNDVTSLQEVLFMKTGEAV